jgi:L-asparaginase
MTKVTQDLIRIAAAGLESLKAATLPLDVVTDCLKALELNESFNAGKGAALQADGQARLTAALMHGPKSIFTSVMSASYITHPSMIARHLQDWDGDARMITTPGSDLVSRQLGLPVESQVTAPRLLRWHEKAQKSSWVPSDPKGPVVAKGDACDTVGCLLRTSSGELFAGTSTGGRGFEFPGRISDSGTVAGTYATRHAAISATGVGEELVDDALAARLETRCRDGLSLQESSQRCFVEAKALKRAYGWIAVDPAGHWSVVHTTPAMSFIVLSEVDGQVAASK